jgi:hypothetical protein
MSAMIAILGFMNLPLRIIARNQILARAAALPCRLAGDPLAAATAETSLNSLWTRRRSGPRALVVGAQLAQALVLRHGSAARALAALEV